METVQPLTIDEMWITPFTARRVYSEEGAVSWVPVERNLNPTGQRHLDFIARSMSDGNTRTEWIAQQLGCKREDLWGLVRTLTGMDVREFRLAWMFRLADELLRYTTMSYDEVGRRAGFGSSSLLCQQFRKYRHFTPDERRRSIRKPYDEGRYRV